MSLSGTGRRRSSSGEGRVIGRLHALFGPSTTSPTSPEGPKSLGGPSSPRASQKARSEDGVFGSPEMEGEVFVDRSGIKVFVATWNMGDSLPKGDLSVLLGHVPPYKSSVPPPDSLPFLPLENAHPYHIVVIAGQECPTDSGVPRGLGGGIMKGMSIKRHGDRDRESTSKSKEKWKGDKERSKLDKVKEEVDHISEGIGYAADVISDAMSDASSITGEDVGDKPQEKEKKGHLQEPPSATEDRSRSGSPSLLQPHTPQKHHHNQSGKGWSTMLDDWLCGPTAIHILRSPSPSSPAHPQLADPASADVARSFSAPAHPSPHSDPTQLPTPTAAVPILRSTSGNHLGVISPPSHGHHPSPLAQSLAQSPASMRSNGSLSSSSSDGVPVPDYIFPSGTSVPSVPAPTASACMPIPGHPAQPGVEKPELVLPPATEESFSGRGGNGCYLHLVKERLMGMYLSVYIYKGCEHLVQGVDKDFVTTGLAGGRLGNKGGIGISLKMADHTFLFVNSHLAAHTGRQAARIANVAKIKSELKLDCFLPASDMRSRADDITERFDTTFWCGDLNFRLEMTRLHAEWLIEQKKYQEALSWDQLRTAMKSSVPSVNPFIGFEEGPIDFPPTFKYDVWRSLKHTNRELRKSIRRKPSDASSRAPKPAAELGASLASSGGFLGGVPEMDDENEQPEDDTASHRSFSSRYSATVPSNAGTDIEEGDSVDMDEAAVANGYANSHRPIDVAVKEKAKHLFNLVRTGSNKVLGTSPGRRISLRRKKVESSLNYPPKQSLEYDPDLRRDSVSTQASASPSMDNLSTSPADEMRMRSPTLSVGSPIMPTSPPMPRRPSIASSIQPVGRKFTALKRTVSGRSQRVDEELVDGEIIEDSREGRYDTSKKQRVPSWCDRVLWKTHVIPDAIEEDHLSHRSSRPLYRLSHAFADLRGHFRQMTRTSTVEPPSTSPSRINTSPASYPKPLYPVTFANDMDLGPSPTSVPATLQLVESPPNTGLTLDTTPNGLVPAPNARRRSDGLSPSQVRHHPLLNRSGSHSSPPAKPRITFDPASSPSTDRRPSDQDLAARRRANSLGSHSPNKSSDTLTNGHPRAHRALSQDTVGPDDPLGSDSTLSRAKTTDPRHQHHAIERLSDRSLPLDRTRTEGRDALERHGQSSEVEESQNAFKRFWRDLPHILGRPSFSVTRDMPEDCAVQADEKDEDERRKRHDRGEVVCLHYGTIDDAGMRQLEGRSDHRPAIFAAAVYI